MCRGSVSRQMSAKESTIQRRVKQALIDAGCHVEVLSCNAYQKGIPDLYVFYQHETEDGLFECHWWVDVKRPKGGTLTKSQVQKWSVWEGIGLGVWILTGEEPDPLAFLLNSEPNWRDWWKPRYEKFLLVNPWEVLEDDNNNSD